MDTISMFPLENFEDFEEAISHMPEEEAAGGTGDVPGQNRIDNQIRVGGEQREDSGQIQAEAEPGPNAPAGAAAGGGEQVGGDEVDPVYEKYGPRRPLRMGSVGPGLSGLATSGLRRLGGGHGNEWVAVVRSP